ncbi:hypothetical protein D9M73_273440 [compost metagenome]
MLRVKLTPAAVATPPATDPVVTGVLLLVNGRAYSSNVVGLVNFSTAPPSGKKLL